MAGVQRGDEPQPDGGAGAEDGAATGEMELFDLRVTVERIAGRSVCGLAVGDYVELVNSSQLRLPDGKHFCLYALAAVLPLLPAKQRRLPDGDWLEQDALVCCPDPEEGLVMRIERTGRCRLRTEDLT
ncbi:MAG: TIGR04076 family protein [Motilibacteraceae bacterium]